MPDAVDRSDTYFPPGIDHDDYLSQAGRAACWREAHASAGGASSKPERAAEPEPEEEPASIEVRIQLSGEEYGTDEERALVYRLEDDLGARLGEAGEVVGNEFGGGEGFVFIVALDPAAV